MANWPIIWILGNRNPNFDKSITWDAVFPNLSEPDVLVIDLTTLTEEVLNRIDKTKLQVAQQVILDKFFHKGIIIVITAPYFHVSDAHFIYSNYYLSPVEPQTVIVPEGTNIKFDKKHDFSPYLREVKKFNFHFSYVDLEKPLSRFDTNTRVKLIVSSIKNQQATDNSGHILSDTYSVFLTHGLSNQLDNAGEVVFLPPIINQHELGLEKILYRYNKTGKDTTIPDWASKIQISGIDQKRKEIGKLNKEEENLVKKIEELESEKKVLLDHLKLLYSESIPLEQAVFEGFKVLEVE